MPHKTRPRDFQPPISLRDLCEAWPLELIRSIVASLPGVTAHEPKQNETWRYAIGSCTVIGYQTSAVVAGSDFCAQRSIEDQIRRRLQPTPEQEQAAHNAAWMGMLLIDGRIAVETPVANAVEISAVLDAFSECDDLASVLALREIAEQVGNTHDARWYTNIIVALVQAHRLGLEQGILAGDLLGLRRASSIGMVQSA